MYKYPSFRFHHTLPDTVVQSEADEAERCKPDDGWTDEPYSKEEKVLKKKFPREPPPPAPMVNSADEQPKGAYVHQRYPSVRYHKTLPPVTVKTEEQDAKLNYKEWRDKPWPQNEFDKVAHTMGEVEAARAKQTGNKVVEEQTKEEIDNQRDAAQVDRQKESDARRADEEEARRVVAGRAARKTKGKGK